MKSRLERQVGTMDHPVYNCNVTTALVYPYGLSQWTHLLARCALAPRSPCSDLRSASVRSRYPERESPKSPFKSRVLPSGDLKIWKSPYLCIDSADPELRWAPTLALKPFPGANPGTLGSA